MHDPAIEDALAVVRAAIATADPELLEAAAIKLQNVLRASVGQAVSPATLESCQRLQALLRTGTHFYSGLVAVMKIQLHGYGNSASGSQPQPGARFVLEA